MGIFVNLTFNKIHFSKLNYAQFNFNISFIKHFYKYLKSCDFENLKYNLLNFRF